MVRIQDVTVRYPGGVDALRGVDLDIDAGDFAVVVGASGSGKTTLLKCLNGSVRPARGTVTVNGTSMALARGRELREARRRIALIPQHLDLIGGSSVLANTLIGRLGVVPPLAGLLGVFSKEDRRAALHNLERVGLAGKEGRRVDTLSGGEQQRVAICRSLAQVPAVMVADEPVASLDSLLAARIMDTKLWHPLSGLIWKYAPESARHSDWTRGDGRRTETDQGAACHASRCN